MQGEGSLASVSLNRHLLENMLRVLLVAEADHEVELWEGSGAAWKMTKWVCARIHVVVTELVLGGTAVRVHVFKCLVHVRQCVH